MVDLDAINAAHQAATQGEWGLSEPWAGYCALTVDGKAVIYTTTADCPNAKADHKYLVAAANAWPAVYAEMLALRAKVTELQAMSARLTESLRHAMNGTADQDALGAAYGSAESARIWLATRDARMKREGAAEWLTGYIRGLLNMEPSAYKGAALAHLPQELERLKGGEDVQG